MIHLRRLASLSLAAAALLGCPAREDLCPPGDYEKVCPPRDTPSEIARRRCIETCRENDELAILRSQMRGEEARVLETVCIAACMDLHGTPGYSAELLSQCDAQYDFVCGLHRFGREGDPTVSERIRAKVASSPGR